MAPPMEIDVSRLGVVQVTSGGGSSEGYNIVTGTYGLGQNKNTLDKQYVIEIYDSISNDPTQQFRLVNFPPHSQGNSPIVTPLYLNISGVTKIEVSGEPPKYALYCDESRSFCYIEIEYDGNVVYNNANSSSVRPPETHY